MKYLDTFSGIGGFGKPLVEVGHECVGFSEISKYAIRVYKKHFPNHTELGDITKIKADELPDFDLLVGGFPCQSFSIAGKRGGFDDTRGTLFFELARILKTKQPKWYIFENVKGLISHDDGNTLGTIMQTLWELGYTADYKVLNSKDFGVPQNRERVFIIGTNQYEGVKEFWHFDYPKPTGQKVKLADILEDEVAEKYYVMVSLKATDYKQPPQLLELTKNASQGYRVYNPEGISSTLASQAGGVGAKTGLYAVPLKFLDRNQKNYQGDYSFTVDTCNTGGVMKNNRIRRLTPTECARLQGFPDDWCSILSDSKQYECYGNAVTTNVIKAIIQKLT